MYISPKSGAAIAATAAALLLSGATVSTVSAANDAKGHCIGANACAGKGACKSAKNECGGHNKCKGQGFLSMTKAECEALMGANKDEKVQITFEEAK